MEKSARRSDKRALVVFFILLLLIAAAVVLYLYARTYAKAARVGVALTSAAFQSILARALPALAGMGASAVLVAVVSLAFQTITQSRVLTPSIIGFDAVFVAVQTALVFFLGSASQVFSNPYLNYLIAAGCMLAVSTLMYGVLLRKNRGNLMFLLMFGLVLSGILRNGARYLQIIMTEQDFNQVQAATNVTVNNMNTDILRLTVPVMAVVTAMFLVRHRVYNLMTLGPDNTKSLGVDYPKEMRRNLMLISLGMSVATALIGSLTFLGLLAVNITRELLKTHRHLPLFACSAAVAAFTLILGQAIVELLQGAVPVTAIIDLAGCSYMFYLILKENRF